MNDIIKRQGVFRYEIWRIDDKSVKWGIFRYYADLDQWGVQRLGKQTTLKKAMKLAQLALDKYSRTDLDNSNLYSDAGQLNTVLQTRMNEDPKTS